MSPVKVTHRDLAGFFGLSEVIQSLYKEKKKIQSSHCGSVETNLTNTHEDAGSIPSLTQWIKDLTLP